MMTDLESVLSDIEKLDNEELIIVVSEVSKRIKRKNKAEAALKKLKGKGKGLWNDHEPQDHVNELRKDRSFNV